MQFRQRLREDDAVSPVIGVILMVAITVILAAVIASFVLGLGPDTATTPTATFDSNQYTDGGDEMLDITMNSGNTIDASAVEVGYDTGGSDITEDGSSTAVEGVSWINIAGTSSEITAGETLTLDLSAISGDYTVRLVYVDGETTSTMQTFEGSV